MSGSNLLRHKRKHSCRRRCDEWEVAFALTNSFTTNQKNGLEDETKKTKWPMKVPDLTNKISRSRNVIDNKSYNIENNNKDHIYFHNNFSPNISETIEENAFVCEICHITFQTKSMLVEHKIKHNLCLYYCDICGELFNSMDLLAKHPSI